MKVRYFFKKSEFPQSSKITLPYGIKRCKIVCTGGSATLLELGGISQDAIVKAQDIMFPIVDGKSPNTFTVAYWSDTATIIEILIEEIGGIPDPNYFSDTPTVIPEIISDEPTEQEEKKDAI